MVKEEVFGKNQFGENVTLFVLTSENGVRVRIMNHGATIVSVEAPDREGTVADIVLGHDSAEEYVQATPYFGCVAGRYANRIKVGAFTLEGADYSLALNNDENALHGGLLGFDKVIWAAEALDSENAVRMTYVSADGEEGYPGEVKTVLTYTLTAANELKIDYRAESTKATPFNITNHSYFNLAGHNSGYHGEQRMMINADTYLPTDATAIPYGDEAPVEGTPFDFRQSHAIGERINDENEQLGFSGGYDHNFCLNRAEGDPLSLAARAEDSVSGRVMEVYTTEPGVQFYAGNYLDATVKGKAGCMYAHRSGFCLETQHYPDSPNQPQFPNTILKPGKPYQSQTVYKFLVG